MSGDWTDRDKSQGKKTLIWISDELRDRIDQAARINYRSMAAEVNKRLMESFANETIDEHGVIVVTTPRQSK